MGMNAGMFFGGAVEADPCDNAPTINSVDNTLQAGVCPTPHRSKATLSITGSLQPSQLYEYQVDKGSGFGFAGRTTSTIRLTSSNCGGPGLFGCGPESFQWRCRVVESDSPFAACSSFVTSSILEISGETC